MSDVGICTKIVLEHMDGFDHMGVHLYTDNLWTSPLSLTGFISSKASMFVVLYVPQGLILHVVTLMSHVLLLPHYQKHMGGVHSGEDQLEKLILLRKSKKWWRIFFIVWRCVF